jgi:sialate O-acetylesterase
MSKNISIIFTGIFLFFTVVCRGQVTLPKLVSDGMVLQRNTEVKIWGWATPGEKGNSNFFKCG